MLNFRLHDPTHIIVQVCLMQELNQTKIQQLFSFITQEQELMLPSIAFNFMVEMDILMNIHVGDSSETLSSMILEVEPTRSDNG